MDLKTTQKNDPGRPSHILGLGASAGGLEALLNFFDHMPPDTGMGFVVIQHLSPNHKSLMDELLSRHTAMKIFQAEDSVMVEPDRIYLLPPKKNLAIFNRQLLLTDPDQRRGLNLPIDIFFRSLAEDQEERAIAVVLSGTGSDGTRGIQAVKQTGGLVIVQDEHSAQFDGMPRSAISTGLADYILPPEKMPQVILAYTNHPFISGEKAYKPEIVSEETDLTKIIAILRSMTGVDFTSYKSSTIVRRIQRRMGIAHKENLREYLRYLHENPDEPGKLFKDMLIGVTKFFRDDREFEALREKVIPDIFENTRDEKSIRVWVAGCSTGEEAFSIAILIRHHAETAGRTRDVKIFATDIDKEAIEKASQGHFPAGIAADMEPELLDRYFTKSDEGFKVRRHIRESVIFASHNLLRDPPFTKLDLVTCRNLLIYLLPEFQKNILEIFHFALRDRGFLFLGTSESVGDMSESFDPMDRKINIFRHKGQGVPPIRSALRLSSAAFRRQNQAVPFAETNATARTGQKYQKRFEALERYYQSMIGELAQACVIVKENGELLETFGRPERFLKTQLGKVDLDIVRMVPTDLALVMSSGIRRSLKGERPVVYRNIRLKADKESRLVSIRMSPLKSPEDGSSKILIVFEESLDPNAESGEDNALSRFGRDADRHILELENEIKFTKENLQATIEELQTSNEELQATNEELLASNEELQSTNEELNSVNEELNTVNAEYQSKITELLELNNDMDNLLRVIEVGMIFLDRELRIRKFTPSVTREINLLRQDIGRPLSDLSGGLIRDIYEDVMTVLDTSRKIEKTLSADSDTWYLVQILPYLDEHGHIGGVVITLVNISQQKNAEKSFESQRDLMKSILDTSPSAQFMSDREGKIIYLNPQAETLLGFDGETLPNIRMSDPEMSFSDLEGKPLPLNESPLDVIRKTRKQTIRYVSMRTEKSGKLQRVFTIIGNPMFDEKGDVDGAVFKLELIAHGRL